LIVFPASDGYPEDEAYFLHFIIQTIDQALRNHPGINAASFSDWIARRHAQVARGELVYIAHQLDFVGRIIRE
jgi:pyruvate/2-oxoglutarate dehydrogenase complex dihydrolipoamide acyltransferase (E2) component